MIPLFSVLPENLLTNLQEFVIQGHTVATWCCSYSIFSLYSQGFLVETFLCV